MDKARRANFVKAVQKKKLIQLIAAHPELVECRVTDSFSYKDSQRLWQHIATQCNALPGAYKTWKQWRKTFQDIRSKTKMRFKATGDVPSYTSSLSPAEQEVLGIKNFLTESSSSHRNVEFMNVPVKQQEMLSETEMDSKFDSEPKSPPEVKVFTRRQRPTMKYKKSKQSQHHSSNCMLNCSELASQEREMLRIKADYYNYKKEYMERKLNIMTEQCEALKSIANSFQSDNFIDKNCKQ